jgi:hypothetical protein
MCRAAVHPFVKVNSFALMACQLYRFLFLIFLLLTEYFCVFVFLYFNQARKNLGNVFCNHTVTHHNHYTSILHITHAFYIYFTEYSCIHYTIAEGHKRRTYLVCSSSAGEESVEEQGDLGRSWMGQSSGGVGWTPDRLLFQSGEKQGDLGRGI